MLKSLLSTIVISASLGVGATPTPSRSSTTQSANTNTPYIQYEYETNEVNSASDLVEGNIYKYSNTYFYTIQNWLYPNDIFVNETHLNDNYPYFVRLVNYDLIHSIKLFNEMNEEISRWAINILYNNEIYNVVYTEVEPYSVSLYFEGDGTSQIGFNDFDTELVKSFSLNFYFILTDITDISNIGLSFEGVSASDYLGNATYVAPTSFYGIINQFIYTHFFNSESLNAQTTTLFGQTITLGEYLAQITTIIILFLMISFCVMLVIWAFKLVSNTFLLNRG